MGNKNNFRKDKAIRLASYRMFVVYKNKYASLHGAYYGDKKYYYSYLTKTGGGENELVKMIIDKDHAGHYRLAWLYENNITGGSILRAWDNNSRELSPMEVKRLNEAQKYKHKRKQRSNTR